MTQVVLWLMGWCAVSVGLVAVWCAAVLLAPVVALLWKGVKAWKLN